MYAADDIPWPWNVLDICITQQRTMVSGRFIRRLSEPLCNQKPLISVFDGTVRGPR